MSFCCLTEATQLLGWCRGLSQQALIGDVAAKVLAGNLPSLFCRFALGNDPPHHIEQPRKRQCNRGYAAVAMLSMLPNVLMFWPPSQIRLVSCTKQPAAVLEDAPALDPSVISNLTRSMPTSDRMTYVRRIGNLVRQKPGTASHVKTWSEGAVN